MEEEVSQCCVKEMMHLVRFPLDVDFESFPVFWNLHRHAAASIASCWIPNQLLRCGGKARMWSWYVTLQGWGFEVVRVGMWRMARIFRFFSQVGRGTTSQALERSDCTNPSFLLLWILAQRTSTSALHLLLSITREHRLNPWMIIVRKCSQCLVPLSSYMYKQHLNISRLEKTHSEGDRLRFLDFLIPRFCTVFCLCLTALLSSWEGGSCNQICMRGVRSVHQEATERQHLITSFSAKPQKVKPQHDWVWYVYNLLYFQLSVTCGPYKLLKSSLMMGNFFTTRALLF